MLLPCPPWLTRIGGAGATGTFQNAQPGGSSYAYFAGDASSTVASTDASGPRCTIAYTPLLPSGSLRRMRRHHTPAVARLLARRARAARV